MFFELFSLLVSGLIILILNMYGHFPPFTHP